MAFRRGIAEAEKASKAAATQFGPRLNFFTWKDGQSKILRFLDDEILTGDFYQSIATNNEKVQTMDFLQDPEGPDWVAKYGGRQKEWGTGNLITPKLRTLGVGVAVLRSEVPSRERPGKLDVIDEEAVAEHDGKKFSALTFGVVKLPFPTFWDQLIGMTSRYGTICDRDYEITRIGADKTTKYKIAPIDPSGQPELEDLRDPEAVRKRYGYGVAFNETDPNRFLRCPLTLDQWIEDYASEKRAKFWLNGAGSVQYPDAQPAVTESYTTRDRTTGPSSGERPPWGGNDDADEAQPVPSGASGFAGVRDQLRSHYATSE